MSHNIVPLSVIKTTLPVTQLNSTPMYTVVKGSSETSYKNFTTNSFSVSSCQFSCPPPSPEIIVSRKIVANVYFQITFTGTTTSGNLLDDWGRSISLRALPHSSSIKTLQLKINDASISLSVNDVMGALVRYNYLHHRDSLGLSYSPNVLDASQSYNELLDTIRNPLSGASNSSHCHENRGGFNGVQILTNTPTSASILIQLSEPLFISPLHYMNQVEESAGLFGVQSLDVYITYDSNLAACLLSVADACPATFSNISVIMAQQPSLLFTYMTPQENIITPKFNVYPYYSVDRYPTQYASNVAPGQSFQMSSNNIQLSSVPKRIYLYCRVDNNNKDIFTTDTFFRLVNINISYGNRSGLLSSATERQLYDIAYKNGCDMSYNSFYGYNTNVGNVDPQYSRIISGVGAVLALDLGSEIGLSALESPGILSNTQLQINATFQNIHPTKSLRPTMYIVTINEGTMTIIQNRCLLQVGVLTHSEVLNASNMPFNELATQSGQGQGGSWWGLLKSVIPIAQTVCRGVNAVGSLAGTGEGEGEEEGMGIVGGIRRRMRRKASKRRTRKGRGGELITRGELGEMM